MMNRITRRRNDDNEITGNWMTTYSDLVTLLLTFFVMLFALSTVDREKFATVSRSLSKTFLNIDYNEGNLKPGGDSFIDEIDIAVNKDKFDTKFKQSSEEELENKVLEEAGQIMVKRTERLKQEMEEKIREYGLEDYVTVVRDEYNVVFRIDSVILFDLGKADIKESGKEILRELSVLLNPLDNDILIQGHTDDLPINTLFFPTNWELSTKRATNVVLFFIEECNLDPKKLTATGNGEYRPARPNDSDENRRYNRRIDIAITSGLSS